MTVSQEPGRSPAAADPSGELRSLAGDCVHCGFCLPACPTYQLWGEEMDSPRGRIHLITQILDGAEGGAAAAEHLDRCLGCMACVTACPSGVRYDRLIEAARGWAEQPEAGDAGAAQAWRPLPPRSMRDRAVRAAIFRLFPYPRRLQMAVAPLRAAQRLGLDQFLERSGLAARLPDELGAALRLAPAPPRTRASRLAPAPPSARTSRLAAALRATRGSRLAAAGRGHARRSSRPGGPVLAERVPARGTRRATVGMLTGCVQRVFYPGVNAATADVLAAEGCDVIIPADQGCCGALSLHGGQRAQAVGLARQTIETFERAGVDAIVVNVAGCGSAMKEYADLLADDARWADRAAALSAKVRDFSEFLAELGPVAPRHPLPVTAAYHDACHLAHAQRITAQPRELLAAIPGLTVTEIADAGTCCGSAGIYNLVEPGPARELGRRKADAVTATGADVLVSGNPGCALQISAALAAVGTRMPMVHLAEVLNASIRGDEASTLLA
jgi:glycolate oxidase iron-sulfur subunit